MDRIRELIQRLATLSADELAELRTLVIDEAQRLDSDEATVEDIALLQELAGFGEQVMAEQSGREQVAAQAQADREAARERIRALNPPEETETPQEPEGQEPEGPQAEAAPAEAAPVAEPIAAAGNQIARMAARQPAPAASPETAPSAPRGPVLMASGLLRGRLDPTAPIENRDELAAAMTETLQRLPRHGPARGDMLLASASWADLYPPERRLGSDAWENARRIEAVGGRDALLASGGVCLPVNVDYSVPTWASAERPLRDALPGFQATRGGLRYVQPPSLSDLAGATAAWTEATDASPGSSTKPIISVACGTEELVYVDAVSTRLGFGNMQSRFAPEQVAANTDLSVAAAARIAENNLLNLIAAQCVADVTSATLLGATRDLLTVISQVSAGYRQTHRLPDSQTLSAIFPRWVRDLIRIDLARELAHDNSGAFNVLQISDAQIDEMIRAHGVNPICHLDGQPSGVAGGVAQTFAAQTASGAVKAFPTKLVWYVYAEGMFQFLDGGRLDLGVVRDSTLDATNDYELFVETFEGVAYRGFANGAYQMVSTLCASGGSAGTVSTAGSCA